MYQKFTSTEIAAQSRSTMETRDHSKNGISSKNQRSRINNLRMVCLALLATSIIFSGCKKPEEPAKLGTATSRYETVPYIKSKNDKSGGLENLVFYDYDEEYNYYFFVLGYVRSVPLAYRSAVYYNGTADFTLKYTMSEVTTESVKSSVTHASGHSTTNTHSTNYSTEIGGKVGTDGTWLKFEASYKQSWGGSDGTSETNSRSFSNTYETSLSTASQTTDELSENLKNSGRPVGMYRWSLFSTTDVYFVVVTNRAKTDIIDAYTAYCARPVQYWILDYDPEEGGSFGKTATGTLLEIPQIILSQLPDIEECNHQWGAWTVITAPTCTTDGEETRTCILCGRTETRSIPATGHNWSDWVENGDEITRICNICSQKETLPFKKQYTLDESNNVTIKGGGGSTYSWKHDAEHTIESLKAVGYQTVTVSLDYQCRANGIFIGAESKVQVYGGHGVNSGSWFTVTKGMSVGSTAWNNASGSADVPIDDFNNLFTVYFHSTHVADHTIGQRTVPVIAKK
jgi:hypothetical protein